MRFLTLVVNWTAKLLIYQFLFLYSPMVVKGQEGYEWKAGATLMWIG